MTDATVIEVELLSGRYHAHLWGEAQFGMGGAEWPPSPWRLLRALASAWFSAQPQPSSAAERDRLLETLARSGPPAIWMPRTSFHELRYYQPVRFGASDRVLHHDYFAVPEGGRFWFRFETALLPDQRALLAELLERLRYFGRSESRARLRIVDHVVSPHGCSLWEARPRKGVQPSALAVFRRVLCTTDDFQASCLWSLPGEKAGGASGFPRHFVDALLKARRPLPCGARWVEYAVPSAALVHEIRPRVAPSSPAPDVDVAEIRFRLNRRIPIPLRLLVAIARAFRDAAVKAHEVRAGRMSPMLSGRELDGAVARGHRHAYYLPRLRQGGMSVEELVVRVPGARLASAELEALLGVTRIAAGSGYPVTVVPQAVIAGAEPVIPARLWRSITPFLPPLRHRGHRDATSVEQQAIACAEEACGLRPDNVERVANPVGHSSVAEVLAHDYGTGGRHWTLTRRLGFFLALTFRDPVLLARPLGADAHFGAGQFMPCYAAEG